MTKPRNERPVHVLDAGTRADERLQAILEGTASETGDAFFSSLARHLALALGVKHVFVGEVLPNDAQRVRTLAAWTGEGFGENFEYSVVDTPCEAVVVSHSVCFYADRIQECFPRDPMLTAIGAESYLGMPLVGSGNVALGLLVAVDDQPMTEDPRDIDLLKIFAARAAAELERQRADAALWESEIRSRLILETTLDAVITIDAESIVTGWNGRAAELFGWSAREVMGRNLTELIIPPEHRDAHRAGLGRFLETGKGPLLTKRFEIDGLHKSGTRLPVELSIATMHSRGGYEFSAFVQDISERRRAESERRRLESQVQYAQKLESLGVLAGGIAHDFNNLLTGILANAAVAQRDLPRDHPVQQLLGEVVQGSKLAAQLTGQLLDYTGAGSIQSRPIDLSAEVRGIRALLQTAVRGRARLKLDLQEGLPAIEGDSAQIHQVLMNLAINAAESDPHEVAIRIRTRSVDLEAAALPYLVPGSRLDVGRHVALEVEDDGCGLDEATLRRVFDPFFTTKKAGRGLGLPSILGIVHQHHGGIQVRSSPGAGTRFRLLFPASERLAESGHERLAEPESRERTTGALILAVDDDPYVLRVIRKMLESHQHDVIVAASGQEALSIFRARAAEIDLVLLDLLMPGMDGEQTFAALRRIRDDVPVLLSSGTHVADLTRRLTADGLAAVLPKPYAPEQLAAAVAQLIGKPVPGDPAPHLDEGLAALRESYREALPGRIDQLAAAVAACRVAEAGSAQLHEAWQQAHKLKGTAGSYGFREIAEALEEVESALAPLCSGADAGRAEWSMIDKAVTRASATLRDQHGST